MKESKIIAFFSKSFPHKSPVHGSCCRADCCCLLLKKTRRPISVEQWGERNVGREAVYDVILLLPAAVAADGKNVSPTAGGETGARGDSD